LALVDRAAELVPPIAERLDRALENAVGKELATGCFEGLPDWEHAPGYMNIGIMLWLRNLVLAFDMVEYGKMRYNLLGNGGQWFPGLNAANLAAISNEKLLGAVKHSPFTEQIPGFLAELDALVGGSEVKRLSQS